MACRIANKEVWVKERFQRIAKLVAEYVEWVEDPHQFVAQLQDEAVDTDIFSFIPKGIADRSPRYRFYQEWDMEALLSILSNGNFVEKSNVSKESGASPGHT